jgi:hypothetical protein
MLLAGLHEIIPVIVTVVPTGPEAGANEVMVGGGNQVKPARE